MGQALCANTMFEKSMFKSTCVCENPHVSKISVMCKHIITLETQRCMSCASLVVSYTTRKTVGKLVHLHFHKLVH